MMNSNNRLGALLFGASLALCATACTDDGDEDTSLIEITGNFVAPESAVWDPATDVWYVANFGQPVSPSEMFPDEPGFISRVAADGTMLEERFVEMAGDFLGMAILDGILYVGHGFDLIAVNLASGDVNSIAIPGAAFLNDVAVGNGALYISDTVANAIYRYTPGGEPEVFSQDPALVAPNGVLVDGDTVIVGTIGAFPPDPVNSPGGLYRLDTAGAATRLGDVAGVFDGVEKLGGRYLVTDFNGPLYFIEPTTGETELITDLLQDPHNLASAADIGVNTDTNTVLIPDLFGGKAYLLTLQ